MVLVSNDSFAFFIMDTGVKLQNLYLHARNVFDIGVSC